MISGCNLASGFLLGQTRRGEAEAEGTGGLRQLDARIHASTMRTTTAKGKGAIASNACTSLALRCSAREISRVFDKDKLSEERREHRTKTQTRPEAVNQSRPAEATCKPRLHGKDELLVPTQTLF